MVERRGRPLAVRWHTRLQIQVALGVGALVTCALVAVLLTTTSAVTRQSMDLAAHSLDTARTEFFHLADSRAQSVAAQVRLITTLPVFRAHMTERVLATDRPTLDAMTDGYRQSLGAAFAVLTDRSGAWLVQPGWTEAVAPPEGMRRGIDAAVGGQGQQDIVVIDDGLFLVVSEPAVFGDEVLGALAVGVPLDDGVARELAKVTGSEINLLVGRHVVASSLGVAGRTVLAARMANWTDTSPGLATLTLGGNPYVVSVYPLPQGAAVPSTSRLVLLQDWLPTQRFLDDIRQQVLQGGLAVLVLALAGGVAFSARVTRPLRDVASAAVSLAAGDWAQTVPVSGSSEAVTMATAFNAMGARLRQSYADLQDRSAVLELEVVERRLAEEHLKLAKMAAEQANLAKSTFLANMSHELRTPLNAIIGYSELLTEQAADLGDSRYVPDLQRVVASGRHLLALISDILDLSKIEAGHASLQVDECDLPAQVRAAVDSAWPLARARGNQIVTSGLDELGTVTSDDTKLQQVLRNLLGNACKFTSDGTIQVSGRRVRGTTADWIEIAIHDTGIGMTKEQVAGLFQDFYQADPSITRRFGGAGLGLAISQRLCHLLGGEITVTSAPGRGSIFTLRLPSDMMRDTDAMAGNDCQLAPAGLMAAGGLR